MSRRSTTKGQTARRDRSAGKTASGHLERRQAVKKLLGNTDDLLIIAGLAGSMDDVLEAAGMDCPTVFAMRGAMGGAAAMGLGLALAQPNRRVVVVTGDGELLMNVGTLATIGVLNPPNLSIVCVDNEHYGETGFQRSHTGRGVDLATMAEAAGIPEVRRVTDESENADAARFLRQSNCTAFILLKVRASDPPNVPYSRDAAFNKFCFRQAVLGRA